MKKTIPKFAITAVAFLALAPVYAMDLSQEFHQLMKQDNLYGTKNLSDAKNLLDRRVLSTLRNAVGTALVKEKFPDVIIAEISEFAIIRETFYEGIQKVLKSVFGEIADAGEIVNKITEMAYGPAIVFTIDRADASRLLIPMVS